MLSWLVVIEPIKDVGGDSFATDRRMRAEWKESCLACEVRPCMFEAVACLAQLEAACYPLQHLEPPHVARGEAQRSLVIEPAAVEIVGCHAWRDARQSFGLFGGSG